MRKSFLVAGMATLAFGTAGVAYAQNAAPAIDATASVSPTKAGTKSKPKSVKFKLDGQEQPGQRRRPRSQIEITFPSTLKLSTKGLDQCTASDDELLADPRRLQEVDRRHRLGQRAR